MIKWIINLWRKNQRKTGMKILFPIIFQKAPNEKAAAYGLLFHFMNDPAWYNSHTKEELVDIALEISKDWYMYHM